jgi:tRNA G37 N-methylase Trm5
MKYRNFLQNGLDLSEQEKRILPSGFNIVGHVALLELKKEAMKYSDSIGKLTLNFDKRIESVALKTGPTMDEKRIPQYTLIAGKDITETIHIENNVRFKLDPLKVTFSGGNVRERIELATRVNPSEYVIDMFACVGQFAIHIAKNAGASVLAIEINPIAFQYLKENISLNGLDTKVQAINGDCREIKIQRRADRIVMGYLHDTIAYLPYALDMLKEERGMIHMHLIGLYRDLEKYRNTINTVCNSRDLILDEVKIRKVKSYAPKIVHFVFDMSIKKNT